jgi:lambda family phage portal protein
MARPKPLPRPTLVDRAVGLFSPAAELRRLQARQAMDLLASGGGYTTVRRRRGILGGWSASDPGPNSALLPDLPELRAESRELYRTAPLARGAISTVVTNVVGAGLQPRPVPDGEASAWRPPRSRRGSVGACANGACSPTRPNATSSGPSTSPACRTWRCAPPCARRLLRGQALPRAAGSVYGLKLQLLDADRCSNPDRQADRRGLAGGIETDTDGAPLRYWFTDRHPGEFLLGSTALNWTPVEAFGAQSGQRQVLHLYHKLEPELLRGEPYLTPVVELLKQLTDYSSAEITAAVVNSCFAVVSKTDGAQGVDLEGSAGPADGTGQPINLVKPGQIVDLGMNETLDSFSPQRPSAAFDPFVLAVLRQIGVALELPYEVLIKHFTSSYSAARAALLEVWKFYRGKRDWLQFGLCQPVYEALVTEAVARGRLVAPGFLDDPGVRAAWLACEWHGPSPGNIDPLRETQALELQMRIRTKTLSQATTELNGTDVIDNLDQIRVEQDAMAERNIVQFWTGSQAGVVTQEQAQTDEGQQPSPAPAGGQQP